MQQHKARWTTKDEFGIDRICGERYYPQYREWLHRRRGAGRYDFGTKAISSPVPQVVFERPLRWYSTDRRQRLTRERAHRDQLLAVILALGQSSPETGERNSVPRVLASGEVREQYRTRLLRSSSDEIGYSRAVWSSAFSARTIRARALQAVHFLTELL